MKTPAFIFPLAAATCLLWAGCGRTAVSGDGLSDLDNQAPGTEQPPPKALTPGLPTIGVLVYPDVLLTEVAAAFDVFSKKSEDGRALFNVITIAESRGALMTEEGLRIVADYTLDNAPPLTVLSIPSAYDMSAIVANRRIVEFIQERDAQTQYTMSNCAGAQLMGESGIADGKKIVTWVGGGAELREKYPAIVVQDDAAVTYVEDGKYLSSNGNLASYVSSLELLEKLTSEAHRDFVESYLYLERLQSWE